MGLPFRRGGGDRGVRGEVRGLGAGLKPGGLGFIAGVEGLPRSELLVYLPG